jgi:hypothetical protein
MTFQTPLSNMIGKTVRTKLHVDYEGTIYNRKKRGEVYSIEVTKYGVFCWVSFNWKSKHNFSKLKLKITESRRISIDELEFLVYEGEESLGII